MSKFTHSSGPTISAKRLLFLQQLSKLPLFILLQCFLFSHITQDFPCADFRKKCFVYYYPQLPALLCRTGHTIQIKMLLLRHSYFIYNLCTEAESSICMPHKMKYLFASRETLMQILSVAKSTSKNKKILVKYIEFIELSILTVLKSAAYVVKK